MRLARVDNRTSCQIIRYQTKPDFSDCRNGCGAFYQNRIGRGNDLSEFDGKSFSISNDDKPQDEHSVIDIEHIQSGAGQRVSSPEEANL